MYLEEIIGGIKIEDIRLPEGLEEIKEEAFFGCKSLYKVELSKKNRNWRESLRRLRFY